jgi:hypothetical protein
MWRAGTNHLLSDRPDLALCSRVRNQYCKVDRSYHLLIEVLLAQDATRRSPDRMYLARPPSDATTSTSP